MRLSSKRSGFLCLVGLSALALLVLSVVPVHGQDIAAPAPTLARKDLLNCELIVVGHYYCQMDNTLSLKVDEVLRGTTCKAGDVLDVKLPQTMLVEFPRLLLVEEFQGSYIDKKLVIPDLN